jgi:predicted transcriptional regulator of viral defense system
MNHLHHLWYDKGYNIGKSAGYEKSRKLGYDEGKSAGYEDGYNDGYEQCKHDGISKKEIPATLLDNRKTEAGYLKISNPALTAIDLIQYAKRVGGINRVATILAELAESIQPDAFDNNLLEYVPVTALQRLGYLLDKVFDNQSLANALYLALKKNESPLFRIPLKAAAPVKGFTSDERWKVIVNTEIEIDE